MIYKNCVVHVLCKIIGVVGWNEVGCNSDGEMAEFSTISLTAVYGVGFYDQWIKVLNR